MATDDKGKDPTKQNATPLAKDGDNKNTDIEQMKTANQQLALQNQQMKTQMEELKSTIISPQYQAFVESSKKPTGQFGATDFAAGRQEVDLENMDRAQFLQHIAQMIDGKIDTTVTPRVNQMQQNIQSDQLKRGIKDAKDAHKDFDNYRLQMTQVSSRIEKSGITADDLYLIASHPGTVEEKPKETKTEQPGANVDLKTAPKDETQRQTAERIADKVFGD